MFADFSHEAASRRAGKKDSASEEAWMCVHYYLSKLRCFHMLPLYTGLIESSEFNQKSREQRQLQTSWLAN